MGSTAGRHARSGAAALVGRSAEIGRVERALAELPDGPGSVLAISGELGIGKTRVLQALCARAADRGYAVLRGTGVAHEHDLPFGLLIDAVDGHFAGGRRERLAAWRDSELALVLPALAARPGFRGPNRRLERPRLHRAVRELLEEMAAERPLVLVLDDMHWADRASSEIVAHLLRRPPDGPILLVLAYRGSRPPDLLEPALMSTGQAGRLARIELAPLTPAEADEILGDAPAALRRSLYRDSGGNPFYLRELAGVARTEGEGSSGAAEHRVPSLVSLALADELGRLSPAAGRLLRGAAVAGDTFDIALAARLADLDQTHVAALLADLVGAGLVVAAGSTSGSGGRRGRWRFRHPIARRAVYESTSEAWRIAAHARAAVAFAERRAPIGVRAHHVERSAGPGDMTAVALLAKAGQQAAPRDPAAAARWFAAAARLLRRDAPAEQRLALLAAMDRTRAASPHRET